MSAAMHVDAQAPAWSWTRVMHGAFGFICSRAVNDAVSESVLAKLELGNISVSCMAAKVDGTELKEVDSSSSFSVRCSQRIGIGCVLIGCCLLNLSIGAGFVANSMPPNVILGAGSAAPSVVPTKDSGSDALNWEAPWEVMLDNGGDANVCGSVEIGTTIVDLHNGNFLDSERPVKGPKYCAALCVDYGDGNECHSYAWHAFYEKQPGVEDEWYSRRCFLFTDQHPTKVNHSFFTSGECGPDPL